MKTSGERRAVTVGRGAFAMGVLETPNKHQTPNTNRLPTVRALVLQQHRPSYWCVRFGVWSFSGAWCLVLGVFLSVCLSAHSAVTHPLRWRWSNPTPHGNNIINMAFLFAPPTQRAVQVTERGQIYTSEDLVLWTPRESGTVNALRAVTFFAIGGTNRIIITGEEGKVLYADEVDSFQNGTLIDGPTADWLEGVAASPTLLVACGDSGAIYTSNTGIQWKRQNVSFANDLNSVTWGPAGFAIAGDSGFIATSVNGTNWTRTTNATANWNRVAYAAGRYTAVGTGGNVIASTNLLGFNWQPENCGASNELFAVAQANVLSARLLAGSNEVRLLEGGLWTNEFAKGASGPAPWTYYSGLAQPDFFLLAGRTGMMFEGYKTNAVAPYFWLPSTDALRPLLFDATYVSNLFIAVGDRASVLSSGDGVTWDLELVPSSVTNSIFLGVGGNTNLLIAVGDKGSLIYSPANLLTNVNGLETNVVNSLGVLWYALTPRFTTNDLQGICVFSNLFVATGDNGKVFTSPNGTNNWTQRNTPVTRFLSCVTPWPGGLVASGDNGNILTSPDGITWTKRTTSTTNWLYRVRYLGGKLIAVGQNGSVYISLNGTAWTKINIGITTWIHDVAKIDDTFFLLGKQGLVMTSTNATNWVDRGTITGKSIYGATTDARQLICVGLEGMILRSPVVPDPTPPEFLAYSRIQTTNTGANLFLFGGRTDQRFTLDYKQTIGTNQWSTGPQLEFYDSSGTLIYLETFPGPNQPPAEFYRATL
ncbi:MAG TPA: hypothetical protein VNT99_10900, partial [Methylomirabilota bacterium]|nr:hypothetical protein [Methylomirabilota bacterium]